MGPAEAAGAVSGVFLVGCLSGAVAHQRVTRRGGAEQAAAAACVLVTSMVGIPGALLYHYDVRLFAAYLLAAWYVGIRGIDTEPNNSAQ